MANNSNEALNAVERRDAQRLRVLRAVFEGTEARTNAYLDTPTEVFEQIGLSDDDGHTAFRWLCDEGLTKYMGQGLAITHEGIVEVEEAIRNPKRATDHFSPIVINSVNNMTFHAPVGAVQNGANAIANVKQRIGAPSDPAVATLLAALRAKLPDVPAEERREAEVVVEDLATEAVQEPMNRMRMRGFLAVLATVQALATPAAQLAQHFFP